MTRRQQVSGKEQWLADLLFDLASNVEHGCIVQHGTFQGVGAILLARGARAGHGAQVYTVDDYTTKVGWIGETYGPEDLPIFRENIRKANVHVTLIHKDISEAARDWTEPIGLWYWDPGAKNRFWQDWLDWSKFVVSGGVAVIKDTGTSDLGATEKMDSIVSDGDFVRELFRGGTTVLRRL